MNDSENTSQPLSMSVVVPGTNYVSYNNHRTKQEHFGLILDYRIMPKWLVLSTVGSQTLPKYQNNPKTNEMREIKEERKYSKSSNGRAQEGTKVNHRLCS